MNSRQLTLIFVGITFLLLPFAFKTFVNEHLFSITLLVYLLMLFGLMPAIVIFIIFPDTEVSVSGVFSFLEGLTLNAGGAFAAFFIGIVLFYGLNSDWYNTTINNELEKHIGNAYVLKKITVPVKLLESGKPVDNTLAFDELNTGELGVSYEPQKLDVCVGSCINDRDRTNELNIGIPIPLPKEFIMRDLSYLRKNLPIHSLIITLNGEGSTGRFTASTGGLPITDEQTFKFMSQESFIKPDNQPECNFSIPVESNIITVDSDNNMKIECLVKMNKSIIEPSSE